MYKLKYFFKRVKRLIDFIPHIWNGADYDYTYAVNLFKYQLSRTADCIKEDGSSFYSSADVDRIRMVIRLMDKVYNEEYQSQGTKIIYEMYGEPEVVLKDSDVFENIRVFSGWKFPNARDEEHNELINNLWKDMVTYGHQKQDRAHDLLWRLVGHNIRNWWS